ncbi:hypothetical protein JXA47_04515 [Candidatus Sumerlaeota bacterium]|nr:hypothetical protein [Candidatus Sumerlaeota bacterium]
MSQSHRRVRISCSLRDCCFWEEDAAGVVFCTHVDKAMHLRVDPCPLYRLDWKRRMEQMREKREKR